MYCQKPPDQIHITFKNIEYFRLKKEKPIPFIEMTNWIGSKEWPKFSMHQIKSVR